jgi:protein ImuA
MAQPAVARDAVRVLRHQIARMEGRLAERLDAPAPGEREARGLLPTGVESFDRALGGGVPAAGLLELHAASRDAGAAAGFALGLAVLARRGGGGCGPLLWIATSSALREAGRPYAPGLAAAFGLAPGLLLLAEARKLADALWIAEEAAALDTFPAVLLEVDGHPARLDLTATRRLHRRALHAGRPLLLLREAGRPEPTAAPLRLLVAPAPAGLRPGFAGPLSGSIGPPAFRVTISKSRTAIFSAFTLEWADDAFRERRRSCATDPVPVVSLPAGRQAAARPAGAVLAFPAGDRPGAAGVQGAGKQHPAHRRPRRAG